ncbi:MAG: hypothetical protein ACYDG4_15155 [Desulfuromonadaceae bacterium]
MIYVLLRPETIMERLNFHFRGIAPSIACDKLRFGPGIVECVHSEADSCTGLPMGRVLRVIWQGGYNKDVAEVKAEYMEALKAQTGLCVDEDAMGDTDEPIIKPTDPAHVEGYR